MDTGVSSIGSKRLRGLWRSVRLLAALFLLLLLLLPALLPGRAAALDELKNTDPEKYYILLDLNNQVVTVYEKDEYGEYTRIVRRFLCTTGRAAADPEDPGDVATPTPRGVWKIGGRERFGKFANFSGEYARYWTQIVGSVFFHSIMFGNRTVHSLQRSAFARLGTSASHGCVRLYVEDARWLYYYACPGTTIRVSDTEKRDPSLKKALKTRMTFAEYNAFQKTIVDNEPLPDPIATVTVEGARLRRGSGTTFATVAKLKAGDELTVLMEGEVWVKCRFGKREGYVQRGYVSLAKGMLDTAPDATLLKTTEWLYAEPDAAAARYCKAPAQVSVKVIGERGEDWTLVQYHSVRGYVPTDRLTSGWGVKYE